MAESFSGARRRPCEHAEFDTDKISYREEGVPRVAENNPLVIYIRRLFDEPGQRRYSLMEIHAALGLLLMNDSSRPDNVLLVLNHPNPIKPILPNPPIQPPTTIPHPHPPASPPPPKEKQSL